MKSMSRLKPAGAIALVAVLSFAAGSFAQGRYPEIVRAENALNGALNDLQHARHIFGGHRDHAVGLINQAIGELEAGKQFAASHGY